MRYFFIDPEKISDSSVLITGSDAKHIRNVLRLKPGNKIGLFDGKGFEYEAEIVSLSPGSVEISVIGRFAARSESPVQIIIAQAMLKDRKMDILIRQLTELGITRWMPFYCERSVPKPAKAHFETRSERWEKIAKEAMKQCKRAVMPEITAPASFETALETGKFCDIKMIFWENESRSFFSDFSETPADADKKYDTVFAVLGPEGGFSAQEIEIAKKYGLLTAGLGPRILRAETATVAACTLLQYFFGDMAKKKLDKTRSF
jgi:16S rRNA (uracil1498-N3)-methyltransferase